MMQARLGFRKKFPEGVDEFAVAGGDAKIGPFFTLFAFE